MRIPYNQCRGCSWGTALSGMAVARFCMGEDRLGVCKLDKPPERKMPDIEGTRSEEVCISVHCRFPYS